MVVLHTGHGGDAASKSPARVAVAAGAYAVATGVIALAGWVLDMPRLTDWKNDGISMFPNTAACAVMSGLALQLAQVRGTRSRPAVRALASAVAAVAGLTLFQHLSGVNLGIDTLVLSRPWGQTAAAAPMRMGPPASVAFLLTGAALLLLTLGAREQRTTPVLGMVVAVVGTLSLTGHLYGASQMYTLPRLTAIALQTAAVVVALGIGIVASVPTREPMRTLLDRGAAGVLTRQALPIVAVLALALGRLRVHVEQIGLVDSPFGTALRTVVELVMLFVVLWWSAARVRRHERAQRESEAAVRLQEVARVRLAAIVESSDDAIISKDLDGIITTWNQGAERLFGYTAAEAVGKSVTMLIPADRQDEEPDILARVRRGARIDHYETVRRRKDGTLLDISLTVSPLLDRRGHVIGASKIARDITERRRAQQQREELLRVTERAREESESANRAKDDFLAMLGHELRNPLSAASGLSSTISTRAGRRSRVAARGSSTVATCSRVSAGRRIVNSAPPPPAGLAACTLPPWSSTIRRTTVRPIPRPPCARSSERAPCRKRSKTFGRTSGAIPTPLSRTRTTASSPSRSAMTVTVPPGSVYFAEFARRFATTCSRRAASAST